MLISGAGANVVALAKADGVLLVDGGAAQHSAALQRVLGERWPGRRVEILFNSNWREEHTGSNAALRAAGATVMAHENTKLWLGGDFLVEWEGRHYTPRPAAELPNKTFYKSGSVDFGGRRVEYWHLPRAHTDGDVAVYFGDANVLAASDLLSVGRYPVPDYSTGGWIGGLFDATQALLDRTDARTRVIAANGAVYGRAELEAQLAMLTAVRQQDRRSFSRRHEPRRFHRGEADGRRSTRSGATRSNSCRSSTKARSRTCASSVESFDALRAVMSRSAVIGTGVATIAALGAGTFWVARHDAAPSAAEQWPLFAQYCSDCHNRDDFTAEIAFDRMSAESIAHEPEIFEARRAQAARRADAAARRAAARQRDAPRVDRGARGHARCRRRDRAESGTESRCTA